MIKNSLSITMIGYKQQQSLVQIQHTVSHNYPGGELQGHSGILKTLEQ